MRTFTALLATTVLMLWGVPAQAVPKVERLIEFSTQHWWDEQNVTFKGAVWRMSDGTDRRPQNIEVRVCFVHTSQANCGGHRYFAPWT